MSHDLLAGLIIFGVLLPMAIVLSLPFLFWLRWRRRRQRTITLERHVTAIGLVTSAVLLVVMFGGFAAGELAPASLVGSLTKSHGGKLLWAVGVYLAARLVDLGLRQRGLVAERLAVVLPVAYPPTARKPDESATAADSGSEDPPAT